ADNRREAVTAWAEQARREIFAAFLESRIGVADRAIVADIARDDRIARQARLNRAPRLTRRHAVAVALARICVPGRARIVFLVIHTGKRLQPFRLRGVDQRLAFLAAGIAGGRRKLRKDGFRNEFGIAADAYRDRFREADAVGIDIDLNDLGILRPVIDAIARQRRERIEARTDREHDVGFRNEFHRRLRAVVAERTDCETMATGETVVVLVVVADRRI